MNKFSFLVLSIAFAAVVADDDGQYRPGKYGQEGKYVPGDEGRYNHDDGQYRHDAGGLSGGFKDHGASRFGNQQHVVAVAPPSNNNQFVNRFVVDSASTNLSPFSQAQSSQSSFGRATVKQHHAPAPSFASSGSSKSYNSDGQSRTLKHESELNLDNYHYAYETDNQIRVAEDGKIVNANTKYEGLKATGFYEYVGPDHIKYRVDYIADENGFQPIGVHLPTPPPIPEEIARILVDVGKK